MHSIKSQSQATGLSLHGSKGFVYLWFLLPFTKYTVIRREWLSVVFPGSVNQATGFPYYQKNKKTYMDMKHCLDFRQFLIEYIYPSTLR